MTNNHKNDVFMAKHNKEEVVSAHACLLHGRFPGMFLGHACLGPGEMLYRLVEFPCSLTKQEPQLGE